MGKITHPARCEDKLVTGHVWSESLLSTFALLGSRVRPLLNISKDLLGCTWTAGTRKVKDNESARRGKRC